MATVLRRFLTGVRHQRSQVVGHCARAQSNKRQPLVDWQEGHSKDNPVCSYNEWDPLEEIIVGRAEGQRVPFLSPDMQAKTGAGSWDYIREHANEPHDANVVNKAVIEVDEFIRVLEGEGVTVRRPEATRWDLMDTFKTPHFEEGGLMTACPRDGLLVVGDEIIEAPMTWRSRVFEYHPYRKLLNEYFKRGATWTAAPFPTMSDDLYVKDFPFEDIETRLKMVEERGQFILTEAEVAFDAADCLRFGKDLFICLSNATNRSGVEWLRRHLEPKGYRVHSFLFRGTSNCHADATVMPLRPGTLVVCPVRPLLMVNEEPTDGWDYFTKRGWEVHEVPEPELLTNMVYVSKWVSMNVLSIDENRLICQKDETGTVNLFKKLGFNPIEVDMRNAFHLGGAFHCWTCDIRRKGELQDFKLH